MTIKQILDAEQPYPDANFRIDGVEVTQVTLVGMVRAVSPQTTNVTLRLDDGTGTVEVKQWLDSDKQTPEFPLEAYVRVWGRLKSFNNKRHVGAHVIKPIEDFNEVNYHLVESTYVHLYFTKGPLASGGEGSGNNNAGGGDDGGDGMFVDNYGGGGNAKLNNCSRGAKTMFSYMRNTPGGNEGVHLNAIANGAKMQVRDVLAAADELLGQGLIYTTIDDETWAILDY